MIARCRRDGGASLILVLVVLLVVSVLALGTLTYVQVSYGATGVVRDARQSAYTVDAALELAIARVAADTTGALGTAAGPACSFSIAGINTDTEHRDLPATVTCAPRPGWVGDGGSRPQHAILTLSNIKPLQVKGQHDLGVVGNVHANNTVTVDKANKSSLTVTGDLTTSTAGGDCEDPAVKATRSVCGTAPKIDVSQLTWAVPQAPPAAAGAVSCVAGAASGAPKTAVFKAGTYTTDPSVLVDAAPSCKSPQPAVWYFPSGAYYFQDVAVHPGAVDVVAGTAGAWWNGSAAVAEPSADGSCVEGSPGAQFIFGGSSSLSLTPTNRPTFSICASHDLNGVDGIALFGPPQDMTVTSASGTLTMKKQTSAVGMRSNNKANVYVHGIVYLPASSVELNLQNKTATYYDGGFVLDHATFDVSASSKQIDSPVSTVACSPLSPCKSDRHVDFTAWLGGSAWLRSRVKFDDGGGSTPGRGYTIESWSFLR